MQALPGPSPPSIGTSAPAECACLDGHPVQFVVSSSSMVPLRSEGVAGPPGLRTAAAGSGEYVPVALNTASRATRPHRFQVRTEPRTPRSSSRQLSHECTADPLLGDDRQQARVPRPRTGSPYGGRVMRARFSGPRRKRVHRDSRRDSPSSGIPPVPHVDRVNRAGVPRLMRGEPAAE